MEKKSKVHLYGWLNLIALIFFLLVLPVFFRMGGGAFAVSEVLPGQAETKILFRLLEKEKTEKEKLFGLDEVEFEEMRAISEGGRPLWVTMGELEKMKQPSYLKNKYYIVDSRTGMIPMDVPKMLGLDLTVSASMEKPKILIFHTHIHEGFADSDMAKGLQEGIWGVGEELKRLLEERYGIAVLHDDGQYDMVNGKGQTTGAYERMEPAIREILRKNPSIEICIDLHRDGVPEGTHLVTEMDGKACAQVMFFNGLCQLNKNGVLQPIEDLENPYLFENLAFSLQMKTAADHLYPDFTRKIYLNAYRFSLHMLPRSSLVEVGAQTNTKIEAMNAMEPLAEILAKTILEG